MRHEHLDVETLRVLLSVAAPPTDTGAPAPLPPAVRRFIQRASAAKLRALVAAAVRQLAKKPGQHTLTRAKARQIVRDALKIEDRTKS